MKNRGFTVLETIVAIAIISLAVAGAFSAVQTGLAASYSAKEDTKAFYLAQEALELLRNKRDGNALSIYYGGSNTWLTGIAESGDPCEPTKTCYADATGPGNPATFFFQCSGGFGTCPYLRQNSSSFLYGYDISWPQTVYKREIQITKTNSHEIAVTILISWTHGILNRQFRTQTILTNWF